MHSTGRSAGPNSSRFSMRPRCPGAVHIEVVTLVIPGLNDSPDETRALIRWIIEYLGPDTLSASPGIRRNTRCVSRDRPARLLRGSTGRLGTRAPFSTLAMSSLFGSRTRTCPVCGALLIERQGFASAFRNLSGKQCTQCGAVIRYVDRTA